MTEAASIVTRKVELVVDHTRDQQGGITISAATFKALLEAVDNLRPQINSLRVGES